MTGLDNQFSTGFVMERPSGGGDVVARLRAYIDDGDYGPGDRLPAERQLIGELGLARGALRRALDALEREGKIWRHVGKGTFVSSGGEDAPASAYAALGDLARQLTPLRMVRARLCIEPAIAAEAALNASAEAVARMRDAMECASRATSWGEYEDQDDRFHRSIAEASDNLLLLALFDQLNAVRREVAFGVVTRETTQPPAEHSSFAEHEAIASAIEHRDRGGAQAAMRAHLQSVSARLFEEG